MSKLDETLKRFTEDSWIFTLEDTKAEIKALFLKLVEEARPHPLTVMEAAVNRRFDLLAERIEAL